MAIIRISHNKQNPFIMVSRKILDLETLSWEAKGLWTYLMGRPDDWNLNINHLTKSFPAGRDKTLRILKELIDHELCFWYQSRLESGVLDGGTYVVFESQKSDEFLRLSKDHSKGKKVKKHSASPINQASQPCPEKPYTAKPTTAEPIAALYNNKQPSLEGFNENNDTPLGPPKGGAKSLRYEKRKEWAMKNQYTSPCGYAQAFEDRYVIISGNTEEVYPYSGRSPFWDRLNLQ